MTKLVHLGGVVALVTCGSIVASACSGTPDSFGDGSHGSTEKPGTGNVSVDLDVAPGVTVDTVSYAITGPGGFTRSGTIDVSDSVSLSAVISGLPAGTGYSINLTATATDGVTTCA